VLNTRAVRAAEYKGDGSAHDDSLARKQFLIEQAGAEKDNAITMKQPEKAAEAERKIEAAKRALEQQQSAVAEARKNMGNYDEDYQTVKDISPELDALNARKAKQDAAAETQAPAENAPASGGSKQPQQQGQTQSGELAAAAKEAAESNAESNAATAEALKKMAADNKKLREQVRALSL
jgi:multidrug resistance efflux pump